MPPLKLPSHKPGSASLHWLHSRKVPRIISARHMRERYHLNRTFLPKRPAEATRFACRIPSAHRHLLIPRTNTFLPHPTTALDIASHTCRYIQVPALHRPVRNSTSRDALPRPWTSILSTYPHSHTRFSVTHSHTQEDRYR